MKEIFKAISKYAISILLLDLGFGVGPINWTMKGIRALKLKKHESELKSILEEGKTAIICFNEKATEGYVYTILNGKFIRSYFNQYIQKPEWAMKN